MGTKTNITWTDTTWNPVTGCSHVSAGCEHCYAETLSLRFGWSKTPWTAPNVAENVILHSERLDQPLRWQKPRRVFVNSMSDLFHERIPLDFLSRVFAVMALSPQHTYQILTKRPERMKALLVLAGFPLTQPHFSLDSISADAERIGKIVWDARGADPWLYPSGTSENVANRRVWPGWPLPNVWLGVSIEEDRWCSRADILRETPAAVRFISAEPLLEPLPSLDLAGIDWLIFGGESGPGGRWMVSRCPHPPQWPLWRHKGAAATCLDCHEHAGFLVTPWAIAEARRLRDLAHEAGAAFFLKQFGGPTPKSAGNLLDGRTWEEFPAAGLAVLL